MTSGHFGSVGSFQTVRPPKDRPGALVERFPVASTATENGHLGWRKDLAK
jgi:hypothetical protein